MYPTWKCYMKNTDLLDLSDPNNYGLINHKNVIT